MTKNFRVFVTGGGGFIAPHIIASLPSNWDVCVHMRKPNKSIAERDGLRIVYGSLQEANLSENVLPGVDVVIHLAGAVHGPSNEEIIDSNLVTTSDVLAAMERCQVPKLVFLSTASVWSDNSGFKLDETVGANPSTLYGHAKLCAERLISASVSRRGIESAVIFRCNTTYGPGCLQGAVFNFIQQFLKSAPVTIYGDGKQLREPLYVGDLVDAVFRSFSLSSGLHLFGMSGPESLTILEMAETIARVMQRDVQVEWREDHPERVRHITIDTSRCQKTLGWAPSVHFEEGICKTLGVLAPTTGNVA